MALSSAKQFETGHVINVDNFYELIQFVTTYSSASVRPARVI